MTDPKLAQLLSYAARGWALLPLYRGAKNPLTGSGVKDASTNPVQIQTWHAKWPSANWGCAAGKISKLTAIDVDLYKAEGSASWDALRTDHPEPLETPTINTGRGGLMLLFQYNPGLQNGTDRIGQGIDVRNDGGYFLIPPSCTEHSYTWELEPDTPLATLPPWMVNGRATSTERETTPVLDAVFGTRVSKKSEPVPEPERVNALDLDRNFALAVKCMALLDPLRTNNYGDWTQVGMALRELGDRGLILWDQWSQKSKKYKRGDCSYKWTTFSASQQGDVTLGTLVALAEKDSGSHVIDDAPAERVRPRHYKNTLARMGYTFALNLMNNDVHISGVRQDDIIRSVLFDALAEHGFKSQTMAENAWVAEAALHRFHPIRDYLDGLVWDDVDHISKLCTYIDGGGNTAFNTFLLRWLVGAVARPMAGPDGCQARCFVLDGKQGIGKSRFVRWLGSPLPQFFMESAISTEDKDYLLALCSTWVWEVSELGATMRKSDRDALKHFVSRQTVRMRKAYGRSEIHKPALASFIPTINSEAGFLSDPTGYRRFMVATVERFNWAYAREVDINAVWSQAVALYRRGEQWELTGEESIVAEDISQDYEIDDPVVDAILEHFEIDPTFADPKMDMNLEWFVPTSAILTSLKQHDHIREADKREAMHIGGIMLKLGCRRAQLRGASGKPQRGWLGVQRRLGQG